MKARDRTGMKLMSKTDESRKNPLSAKIEDGRGMGTRERKRTQGAGRRDTQW